MRQVQDFLALETHLLNVCDWRAWAALFSPEGRYWMPARADQSDPILEASLLYDDAALIAFKVARLEAGDALSLQSGARMLRQLGAVLVEGAQDGLSASAVISAHQSAGSASHSYHALVNWRLAPAAGSFQIVLKRVDLLDIARPQTDILFYI
jgi:3-phenylpropionate/cinnamic acid dioxygenase small subunit